MAREFSLPRRLERLRTLRAGMENEYLTFRRKVGPGPDTEVKRYEEALRELVAAIDQASAALRDVMQWAPRPFRAGDPYIGVQCWEGGYEGWQPPPPLPPVEIVSKLHTARKGQESKNMDESGGSLVKAHQG